MSSTIDSLKMHNFMGKETVAQLAKLELLMCLSFAKSGGGKTNLISCIEVGGKCHVPHTFHQGNWYSHYIVILGKFAALTWQWESLICLQGYWLLILENAIELDLNWLL